MHRQNVKGMLTLTEIYVICRLGGPYSERLCFSLYGPTLSRLITYLIFFSKLLKKKKLTEKAHASVTVTMARDRKIQTALRTNQIVGFVTVPAWKKVIVINNY